MLTDPQHHRPHVHIIGPLFLHRLEIDRSIDLGADVSPRTTHIRRIAMASAKKKKEKEKSTSKSSSPPPPSSPMEPEKPVFLSAIASPLAKDALAAKVLKTVRAAVKRRSIRRGVKEVVKALRKASAGTHSLYIAPSTPPHTHTHHPRFPT